MSSSIHLIDNLEEINTTTWFKASKGKDLDVIWEKNKVIAVIEQLTSIHKLLATTGNPLKRSVLSAEADAQDWHATFFSKATKPTSKAVSTRVDHRN